MTRRFSPLVRRLVLPLAVVAFVTYFAVTALGDLFPLEQLGAEFLTRDGRVVATVVAAGGPADRAGIRVGDEVLSVEGRPVRNALDWASVFARVSRDRPMPLTLSRDGVVREGALRFRARADGPLGTPESVVLVLSRAVQLVTLVLAIAIAVRGRGREAAFGAWLLATTSIYSVGLPPRMAVIWMRMPDVLQPIWLLPSASKVLIGYILFAFFRTLLRRPLLDRTGRIAALVFVPCLAWDVAFVASLLHWPQAIPELTRFLPAIVALNLLAVVASLVMMLRQYRALAEPSARRRLRWVAAGTFIGCAAAAPTVAGLWLGVGDDPTLIYHTPATIQLLYTVFLVMPLSFWWAIARRQIFDIEFVVRRGVQYLFARHVLLVLTPATATLLVIDAIAHREQPLSHLFQIHAALYIVVAIVLVLIRVRRDPWLEAIDRRLFRERYNAVKLLRDLAADLRVNRDLVSAARFATTRIDAALHPQWIAMFAGEATDNELRGVLDADRDRRWPRSSSVLNLLRSHAIPLEVHPQSRVWPALDEDDRRLIERTGAWLVVPILTGLDRQEAVLMLGPKRSEEPYGQEDKTLLQAVAASIGAIAAAGARVERRPDEPEETWEEHVWSLADTVASGKIVNWEHESAVANKDDHRQLLMELQALERLMQVHCAPTSDDGTLKASSRQWGPFALREAIGRGRFATVYRAWDPTLERFVAVKLLHAEQIDHDACLREARHLARVRHPNVVQVYGVDVLDNVPGFWMELLEGETLAAAVSARGPLPILDILSVATSMCRALTAVHRAGLVHQDVKAENVMRDREGRFVLMDIGAGVADASRPRWGTPRYMAPELFRGASASAQSDIYSLGVLLFYLAVGALPVDGTLDEIVRSHDHGGWRRLEDLRPDLPGIFVEAVERAIADDPAARFGSADQLRAALLAEAV